MLGFAGGGVEVTGVAMGGGGDGGRGRGAAGEDVFLVLAVSLPGCRWVHCWCRSRRATDGNAVCVLLLLPCFSRFGMPQQHLTAQQHMKEKATGGASTETSCRNTYP